MSRGLTSDGKCQKSKERRCAPRRRKCRCASKNPRNPSNGGGHSVEGTVEGGAPRNAKNPHIRPMLPIYSLKSKPKMHIGVLFSGSRIIWAPTVAPFLYCPRSPCSFLPCFGVWNTYYWCVRPPTCHRDVLVGLSEGLGSSLTFGCICQILEVVSG